MMTIMSNENGELQNLLRLTFAAGQDQIKTVEQNLLLISQKPGFLFDLLQVVFDPASQLDLKLSAAVMFKNHVIRHWPDIERNVIPETTRNNVKERVFECYLSSMSRLRPQFITAILTMCTYDFPNNWSSLLPRISLAIRETEKDKVKAALKLASCMFKHYCIEEESDVLFSEIKYVLDVLTQPLLTTFESRMLEFQRIHTMDTAANSLLIQLKYMIRIFMYLTVQVFPDSLLEFKDLWFSSFLIILKSNLEEKSEINRSILTKIKSSIVQICSTFVKKHTEDFMGYINAFMETIWYLSTSPSNNDNEEILGSECLLFIKSAFTISSIRHMFEFNDEMLSNLFINIIIPNLMHAVHDQDIFDDDPLEYVRTEIEGCTRSRRQSASDLVGTVAYSHEEKIIPIIIQYVSQLIQKSNETPDSWKYKDAAIRLVISVTNKFDTIKLGTSEITPLLDVNKIFSELVLPIFSDPSINPMLLSCVLKYIITFRKLINSQLIDSLIPNFVSLMSHSNLVVKYMSCIVVSELILPPDHPDANSRLLLMVDKLQIIYSSLIAVTKTQTSVSDIPFKSLVSVMLKTHSLSKDYISPILESLLTILTNISSMNINPIFLFSLFETIGLCYRFSYIYTQESFVAQSMQFITIAHGILLKDSSHLFDYVSQVLSIIFSRFYPFEMDQVKFFSLKIIEIEFWEGDVSHYYSLSLLAGSLMKSASSLIISQGHYNTFIKVFKKYCHNVRYDTVVFHLIKPMVTYLPWTKANIEFPDEIFDIVFSRLTRLKKPRFISGFLDFLYHFVTVLGSDKLVKTVERIQPTIVFRILKGLFLPEILSPIPIMRKKCLLIACCQILVSITAHVAYDSKDWANDFLIIYNSNPPTTPIIRPDYEEYYKSLGNVEQDLIPSFEPVTENTLNVMRFAVTTFDLHPHIIDVKAHIVQVYQDVKSRLKEEAIKIIENVIQRS